MTFECVARRIEQDVGTCLGFVSEEEEEAEPRCSGACAGMCVRRAVKGTRAPEWDGVRGQGPQKDTVIFKKKNAFGAFGRLYSSTGLQESEQHYINIIIENEQRHKTQWCNRRRQTFSSNETV